MRYEEMERKFNEFYELREGKGERLSKLMEELKISEHRDNRGFSFFTTGLFWDCECRCNYIHSMKIDYCVYCDCWRDHQPDSRVNEVCRLFESLGMGKEEEERG